MSDEETTYPVKLYVYDLSRGLARSMSQQLLGTSIDAIYHTSIVYNDVETYYGSGIQHSVPAQTHHGYPEEIVHLGETSIPPEIVEEYLSDLKEQYTHDKYDLFDHNCNHFTEEMAQFLVGKSIPDSITSLPHTVLQTPFGQMLRPIIDQAMRPIVQAPTNNSSPFQ